MTHELTILTLAALLQVLQFFAYATAANRQLPSHVALGPRDDKPELTGAAGRLQRAMNNHFEALILFTIACVVVTLGEESTQVTRRAANVYLIARILYVPAYVFAWSPWRSAIWAVGFFATLTMLIAALI